MTLIDIYRAVLATAKLTATDDGYISSEMMGEKQPFTVGGKRLVLPTNEQLRNPDRETRVIFHPLHENPLVVGESEVLAAFRNSLNTRLNGSVALLFANLLQIAISVAEHKKLNPDQSEFLSLVKDVDNKSFDDLAKIIAAMPLGQTKKAFISIYLKKGAIFEDRKYKKGAVVSFPIYKELQETKGDIYGVNLRQKDRKAFKALLEYIFPDIDKPNAYSKGSGSDVAPSIEAIMGAVLKIGEQLNTTVEAFKNVLDDPEEMIVNHEWVEAFGDIQSYLKEIMRVPPQLGNEGRAPVVTEEETESTEVASSTPVNSTAKIPIKEKLTFVGLQNPNTSIPLSVAPQPAQKKTGLSLSEAMGGSRGFGVGVGIGNNTRIGAPNNLGFVALPNQNNTGFFNTGFGNTGSPFGFVTPRI